MIDDLQFNEGDHYPEKPHRGWQPGERELAPELAFDKLAHLYDAAYHGSRRQKALDDLLADLLVTQGMVPQDVPQLTLDAGCGTGHLLELRGCLVDPAYYVGVDMAQGMLREAKRKFPLHPFFLTDMTVIRRLKMTFGRVISLGGAFSYVHDPRRFVDELHSRMAISGKFLIVAFAKGYPGRRARKGELLQRVASGLDAHVPCYTYTPDELGQHFSRLFNAVEVRGLVGPTRYLPDFLPQVWHQLALGVEGRTLLKWKPHLADLLVVTGRRWT